MQYKINTDPKKMIGKRPNLAEEESVTDNIVSALSVPPEDMPLPPLSPLPKHTPASATPPRTPRKRNPKAPAIIGTVFIYLPVLIAENKSDGWELYLPKFNPAFVLSITRASSRPWCSRPTQPSAAASRMRRRR